jgi:hypothetical protein
MSPYRRVPRFSSVRSRTIGGDNCQRSCAGACEIPKLTRMETGRARPQLVFLVIGVEFDPVGKTMRRISRLKYLSFCCRRLVLGRLSLRHRVEHPWGRAISRRSSRPGGSVHAVLQPIPVRKRWLTDFGLTNQRCAGYAGPSWVKSTAGPRLGKLSSPLSPKPWV